MWAKRSLKAARILTTVMLASASTLVFLQSDGGKAIYGHYFKAALKGNQVPSKQASVATSDRAAPITSGVIEKKPSSVDDAGTTGTATVDTSGAETPSVTTGTASGRSATTGSATTGSATTTGAAGQTGSAKGSSMTTGAAGPIAAPTAGATVLAYGGLPADARLKLIVADLRSDLRKSILEATRAPPKSALQYALDAMGRSQDRADLLVDIARDADVGTARSDPRRSGLADAPDNHATTGLVRATAVTVDSPGGMVTTRKGGSPWLEPGVLVSMMGILIALVIAWFGDNLGEKLSRRRDDAQLGEKFPANTLLPPDAARQLEHHQPASST